MAPQRHIGEKEKSQVSDTSRVKRQYRKSSTAERDPWTKPPKFAGQATFNSNKGLEQVRVARSPASQSLSSSPGLGSVSPSLRSIQSVSESACGSNPQSPNTSPVCNGPSQESPSIPGLIRDSMLRYLLQIQKNSHLSLGSRSPRNLTTKKLLTTAYKALLQFQDSSAWRSASRVTTASQQQYQPVFARRQYFESSRESENWKLHAWKQLNLLDEGLSMELDTMDQPWEKMSELLDKCRNLVEEAKSSKTNLDTVLLTQFSKWMESIHEFMEALLQAPTGSGSLDEVKTYLLDAKNLLGDLETLAPDHTHHWQEFKFGIDHYLNCLKWFREDHKEPAKPPDSPGVPGEDHSDEDTILYQMFSEVADLEPVTASLDDIDAICQTRAELFNVITVTLKGWSIFGQAMPKDAWVTPEYFRQVYHILSWIALPQAAFKILAWVQDLASTS